MMKCLGNKFYKPGKLGTSCRLVLPMLVTVLLCLAGQVSLFAEDISTRNQFSMGLTGYGDSTLPDLDLGVRWQSDLKITHPLTSSIDLSLELSTQSAVTYTRDNHLNQTVITSDLYRCLLKLENPQTELRAGLQRLNFGTAQILRPLQWFDSLVPLDALEQTGGVEALLIRHYFPNNSNLWLWGMLADDKLKGNELFLSKADTPELGGRYQFPNPLGESAISFHTRELSGDMEREYRLGLDHRLDSFIGAWFEVSGSYLGKRSDTATKANSDYTLRTAATIGADYTVGIGNGLAITIEHMSMMQGENAVDKLRTMGNLSALMASYPLGLLDNALLVGMWNWTDDTGSVNIVWRRAYDYLSMELRLGLDSGIPAVISRSPSLGFNLIYNL